jgi:ABC-type glutathione transport system ATPase component
LQVLHAFRRARGESMTTLKSRPPQIQDRAVGQPAIQVRGLRKRYGDFEAVRGVDLAVRAGEIFAFLGPPVIPGLA